VTYDREKYRVVYAKFITLHVSSRMIWIQVMVPRLNYTFDISYGTKVYIDSLFGSRGSMDPFEQPSTFPSSIRGQV
jgi:hypothetical protein